MTLIQNIYIGKVRNSISLSNKLRILQTSNRISAFDFIFPFEINNKAEILQAISTWYFKNTSHIIENHLIGSLDTTHVLVKEAKVFPIEIVVRGYLSGSLWRLYKEKGAKEILSQYGIYLPDGMQQNQKFPEPIITPTTKAEMGHDLPISAEMAKNLIGAEKWNFIAKKSIELFHFGSKEALAKNLILVDTKYEMGEYDDKIILVDEVHTPDSSRYWIADKLDLSNPKQMSKEFLREELIKLFGSPENIKDNPANHPFFKDEKIISELIEKVTTRYLELYQTFIGSEKTPLQIANEQKVAWPIFPDTFKEIINAAIMPKNVLVVGNGGRDYTIYSSFQKLPEVSTVFCAAGKRLWDSPKFANCPATDVNEIAQFAAKEKVGLVIAGPELPIANGIAPACEKFNIPVLAPSLACASLEASKIICKEIVEAAKIKTAKSKVISWSKLKLLLLNFLENPRIQDFSLPCVLKYDSLAAGKGVFVLSTHEDIKQALITIENNLPDWEIMTKSVEAPTYSNKNNEPYFLIEETLIGEEISVIALCNNEQFRLLPIARDYKRRNNKQTGPNTGGMGTVSPVELSNIIMEQVKDTFTKILKELNQRNTPYHGFLFAGFMIDKDQNAWLLEFNCRLGDPETQVILPGLQREFYIELYRTAKKQAFLFPEKNTTPFLTDSLKRVFVVGASPEYPEKNAPKRKLVFTNNISEECQFIPTAIEPDQSTSGGRAFGLLSSGKSISIARKNIYSQIQKIKLKDAENTFVDPHYRTDIGQEFE
ncbi:phosphoribosylaminoimidazolesuccinocarboxamide synthase [Pigmentibacter sp. JX0631]|uniref:phosphoribosylaminoimidazolesuccinocarboxamide synthase n=1 Tax=Pigmentibacter sp. JX0631 TaxID=2976982 RepID=UPI002468B15D|nr:phosphoribosylaminoimidazolesuccinocarboxamide synthase [Pigmentibacter sp. JX0631]WGL59406.1 phosphoribosylaminoimidazolesuccinocarboxamide synthase [Pigmentibacter sp. JX0631]